MTESMQELVSPNRQHQMKREYRKWFSPHLNREMELLIFGDCGAPVIFFPTRTARFYDYEDWGVIEAMEEKILSGKIQVYCVDSIDEESLYCKDIPPAERMQRHLQFEKYLLYELLPLIQYQNNNPAIVSAGCSLGAYHAVNLAFRHPEYFKKVIGLSGRYDLSIKLEFFDDLFDGYWDEEIYYNMPGQYVHNINSDEQVQALQNLDIIFVVGVQDAFLENNLQLSRSLREKNIVNTLHLLEGEAHKARYWGELMEFYL
ncbi:MAG: putative esterase [Ferruginibacter sp.]|nr:putative esterase [Ferruginibacter sp.]